MSASTIRDILYGVEQTIRERFRAIDELLRQAPPSDSSGRIQSLEARLDAQAVLIAELKKLIVNPVKPELLPLSPMLGLEVVRKPEILPVEASTYKIVSIQHPITTEAEVEIDMESDIDGDSVGDMSGNDELEEFEYKGATYYRDSENNVFTTDDDGELNSEPFGIWNEAKQRIVARK